MRYRLLLVALAVAVVVVPAPAYVEAPMSLGSVLAQSTHVLTMVVTKVDKQKNLIVFKKVQDIKGKHPQDEIKHNIGFGGLRPGEWLEVMNWAEVGKPAVFWHNGGASETYTGTTWYQAYPQGEWWGMSHGEPFLLRSYSGKVEKLGPLVADMLAGKEVVVPCMVDGDKEALHKKTARVQRLKASLKLQDYNPKRDFAGWGGEDIRRLAGMPGFDRLANLGSAGADAQAVTCVDFDGDGKLDVCLCGANRVLLLQNGGDAFTEVALPGLTGGARAAVWADSNGDGTPDLLLATPTGPRLYANLGQGRFRDDTRRLPREDCYNLTAAAWIDADGDGKPDILLANGFHGLRLYRNLRADAAVTVAPPKLGDWHAVGPFRHKDGPQHNADFAFAPEKDAFDPAKVYRGKRDMECKWAKGDYPDGRVNPLAPFGANCSVYLHREIESAAAAAVPVSLGSRDSLSVWLNGERVHFEKAARQPAADQVALTLTLKAGKNHLLLKVTHGDGEGGFYFRAGDTADAKPLFADVSAAWGLGPDGIAADTKGDTLTTADFTGDGRTDVLYGAGSGLLLVNTGTRFVVKADAGLAYTPGKVGPAVGDFDSDGHLDLFVPQPDGRCKLYRNDGTGRFADVTAAAGDLAKPIPGAVGAAWGDLDADGKPDLIVTCLRGPNRFFRNAGGTFADRTGDIGLSQRVFNSQAACVADVNGDGKPDLVLANEGQESTVLFGAVADAGRGSLAVTGVPVGGRVRVLAGDKAVAVAVVTGGDGRGGQTGLIPRFALPPGAYTVEVHGPDGRTATKPATVGGGPAGVRFD